MRVSDAESGNDDLYEDVNNVLSSPLGESFLYLSTHFRKNDNKQNIPSMINENQNTRHIRSTKSLAYGNNPSSIETSPSPPTFWGAGLFGWQMSKAATPAIPEDATPAWNKREEKIPTKNSIDSLSNTVADLAASSFVNNTHIPENQLRLLESMQRLGMFTCCIGS